MGVVWEVEGALVVTEDLVFDWKKVFCDCRERTSCGLAALLALEIYSDLRLLVVSVEGA